nr:hypothetical protein [Herbaspirillum sp. ASV7]
MDFSASVVLSSAPLVVICAALSLAMAMLTLLPAPMVVPVVDATLPPVTLTSSLYISHLRVSKHLLHYIQTLFFFHLNLLHFFLSIDAVSTAGPSR